MRKFILSDRIAKKLRGLENRPPEKPEESAAASAAEEAPVTAKAPALWVTSRTDVGLVRKNNQDAVILGGSLMGIADGMGGHNGGETASAGARDGLLRELAGQEPTEDALRGAIERVNLALWDQQLQDSHLSGMGTTLTVLWPTETEMLIGHVGDSRAYLLRDGELRQVTQDHSMVADMVRRGILTEEQAATHPMRNYITRAVGTEPEIQVDVQCLPRKPGDRWLVCSDGLHGMVAKERLRELMAMADPEEGADQMIREALDQGGRDNVSLVLALDEEAHREEAAE
ncbi:MAG: Stp1/IreP family PP2C-type Ser/Thr phosphatase [Clostridia bacterium]|nr:Stp1/IreP family PP2C-type Ser/Thr phosphatase [Clostridia bacterium]